MDPKLAAIAAKKLVEVISNDPDVSPDLRRILTQLMGADLKSLEHRRTDTIGAIETLDAIPGPADLVTLVDAEGTRRYLVFV
jgi:hypothetical protein